MASSDPKAPAAQKTEEPKVEEKKPAAIGEDDEFEDFPAEGMLLPYHSILYCLPTPIPRSYIHHRLQSSPPSVRTPIPSITTPTNSLNPRKGVRTDEGVDWSQEDTEAAGGANTKHLWEESWDDDDTTDDFSAQLKEELKKVEAAKKR